MHDVRRGWKVAYVVVPTRKELLLCLKCTERGRGCEDERRKEAPICAVSTADYFTSISLCIGFYILFRASSYQNECAAVV